MIDYFYLLQILYYVIYTIYSLETYCSLNYGNIFELNLKARTFDEAFLPTFAV